jgi:hypothetical protein
VSQGRCGFFSNAYDRLKVVVTSKPVKYTAGFLFQAGLFVLDFAMDEKSKHDEIDWNALPSQYIKLFYAILLTACFNKVLENFCRDHFSVKKLLPFAAAFAYRFSDNAITNGLDQRNYPFVLASASIEGFQLGGPLVLVDYALEKNNYSFLPVTHGHAVTFSLGLVVAAMQNMLNFIVQEMMKNDVINWNDLASPETASLMAKQTAALGFLYGTVATYYFKYLPNDYKNYLCAGILFPVLSIVSSFFEKNVGYAILSNFVNGIPAGVFFNMGLTVLSERREGQLDQQLNPPRGWLAHALLGRRHSVQVDIVDSRIVNEQDRPQHEYIKISPSNF